MYEQLKSYSDNTLFLTVNRRLALRLQQNLASKSTLPKPAKSIYALADWFQLLWQQQQAKGHTSQLRLLSQPQEQTLWLQTLQASPEGEALLQPYQAAKQLMTTWKLLCQWDLELESVDWHHQEEGSMYYQWAQAFYQTLEDKQWMTQAQMPTLLLKIMQDQSFRPIQTFSQDQKLVLVGFDDVPPQTQQWLEAFKHFGWSIEFYRSSVQQEILRYEFSDPDQELFQAIHHAHEWSQHHEGVFALIVPDLTRQRRKVEQCLNQVCEPSARIQPQRQVSSFYNISAALSLSELPIIQALFYSFDWLTPSVPVEKIMAGLNSPFLGHFFSEQKSRELFNYHLKQASKAVWSDDELIHLAHRLELPSLETWFKSIQKFKSQWLIAEPLNLKNKKMMQWLSCVHWPGERPLNSIEHQAVQSFYQQLSAWQSLQCLHPSMTGPQVIQSLTRIVQDSAFQPESKPAKIQVMGLLEAAGQEFDRAWVLGMNHEAWPAPPKPNPFIPLSIQKELKMPHASAERELMFATELTRSLKNSAPQVTFSHALSDQGKHFFASPLLNSIPVEQASLQEFVSLEQILHQHRKVLTREEPEAVALSPEEEFYGGVSIIQEQAACPFKAFATFRLHAQEPERYQQGIHALDRGVIVHRAMELIWQDLNDHSTLVKTNDQALDTLIERVLTEIEADPRQGIERNLYWDVEKKRLKKIVRSWLTLEKRRDPFKVVQLEKKTRIALNGLTLKCRIDRVDLNEQGQPIIIDYKTGQVTLKECFGDRPDAPQLPLYCFADFPPDPKGVVFAVLKRDQCVFIGVSEAGGIPGVSSLEQLKVDETFESWGALLDYWRPILDKLAQEFVQGLSLVAPKSSQTCNRCDLSSVCRVGEVA